MVANAIINTTLFSDANLVAYYQLENVSDSKASYTLTNNNTVAFNAGKFNNAADGGSSNTNKSLSVTDAMGIGTTTPCTFMGWVNITTAPASNAQQALFYHATAATGLARGVHYWNNGGTLTLYAESYGASDVKVTYVTTLTPGTWYHVAYTDDNTDVRLYLNGALVAGPTAKSAGTVAAWIAGVTVLCRSINPYDLYTSGLVDDFAIFSRVLTTTEISNYYNGLLNIQSGFFTFL
jgi:hypothetical protein